MHSCNTGDDVWEPDAPEGSIDILAMNSADSQRSAKPTKAGAEQKDEKKGNPQWAAGLKQLYDSVVDEPLPDSFRDLIAKLDSGGKK